MKKRFLRIGCIAFAALLCAGILYAILYRPVPTDVVLPGDGRPVGTEEDAVAIALRLVEHEMAQSKAVRQEADETRLLGGTGEETGAEGPLPSPYIVDIGSIRPEQIPCRYDAGQWCVRLLDLPTNRGYSVLYDITIHAANSDVLTVNATA